MVEIRRGGGVIRVRRGGGVVRVRGHGQGRASIQSSAGETLWESRW